MPRIKILQHDGIKTTFTDAGHQPDLEAKLIAVHADQQVALCNSAVDFTPESVFNLTVTDVLVQAPERHPHAERVCGNGIMVEGINDLNVVCSKSSV